MTRFGCVAAGFLIAGLSGCSDPAPDPSRVEEPRSVYDPTSRSPATLTTPIEVVPDSPTACDGAADAAITATVYWNAKTPTVTSVEIHVRAADEAPASAKLWTRAVATGKQRAPAWVRRNTVFELRDTATQDVIASTSVSCD